MSSQFKPLIGITTGANPDYREPWKSEDIGQRREYVDAVVAAGGVPVLLPISTDSVVIERLAESMDGFLFAGGDDIDPVWYGEENLYSVDLNYRRDTFEVRLLEQVEKSNKPILGICRGMQILNVSRGGTLYQDIPAQTEGKQDHQYSDTIKDPAGISHRLRINPNSRLANLVGVDELEANSRHHQSVKDVGRGLVVTAWAEDEIVEALEDPTRKFLVGIQSHPESMHSEIGTIWSRVFKGFIQASSNIDQPIEMRYGLGSSDVTGEMEEVSIVTNR